MKTSLPLLVVTSLAVLLAAGACGDHPDGTCEETLSCGSIADGGDVDTATDGGSDVVQPPAGCDPNAEPKDAPKCVVSEYGVFVDATSGNDANNGTKELPLKTIGAAIERLGGKPRIYVCDGTYGEQVKLTSAVSIYGGFTCGAWSYSGAKARVSPASPGYALDIENVTGAASLADLAFVAAAGDTSSPSSIAAFVKSSPNVTLRRVELEAMAGAKGKDETKGADGALMTSTPTPATLNGNSGGATMGGLAQLCTCVGGDTSKGGGGGNLNSGGEAGETAQATPEPPTATGAAQTASECNLGTNSPKPGSNAPNASPADGAKKIGALEQGGWLPEAGKSGGYGEAGQGGGGGGGSGGGGGGGACGGCGGGGGKGGGGGGASVALLAVDSPITLSGCMLKSANGGAGGNGAAGGDGIAGGTKGARGGAACDGANGGKGGNGGAGGGGAGGLSIGVLYKGTRPNVDSATETSMTIGSPGDKGAGGAAGVNGGVSGIAEKVKDASTL